MVADPPHEDWQREAARFRTSPLDALGEAVVLGEAELREHLYLLGVPLPGIDRAVARAKGWASLTPLEQAILDLPLQDGPSGEQIWHALPEALRPAVGEHEGFAMLELELTLRGIERRGMLVRAATGPQPSQELNAAIDGWATVPVATRIEVYECIIAGASEDGGPVAVGELNLARLAILLQGLAGAAGPGRYAPGSERQRALVEKAEAQLSGFDFSDRTVEQDALLDRLLGPGVVARPSLKEIALGSADEWARKWAARAHEQASGARSEDLVLGPENWPAKERPRCARCQKPVESLSCFDDGKTGGLRFAIVCHGETRDVHFYPAELIASGPQGALIAERLAAVWGSPG